MNIYISGISGTGLGPLALMSKEAGIGVSGSDTQEGAVTGELVAAGIEMQTGAEAQNGDFLQKQFESYFQFGEGLEVIKKILTKTN